MELNLSVTYEVTDTTPEVKDVLEEIIAEEARGFAETVRQRLAAAGVKNITTKLTETT